MPIAGVIIVADSQRIQSVYECLQNQENITTYGIHNDNQIVAVFEADSSKKLEDMSESLMNQQIGILGVYPAYVNFEDEIENIDQENGITA